MSKSPLFERQETLAKYLLDPQAFLASGTPLPTSLIGMDIKRLEYIGKIGLQKRLTKVKIILPKTFELLGGQALDLFSRFSSEHLQKSVGKLDNAVEFADFLKATLSKGNVRPAFLLDVLGYEIIYGMVRNISWDDALNAQYSFNKRTIGKGFIRPSPCVKALRCKYDIRELMVGSPLGNPPSKQEIFLIFSRAMESSAPRVFEVEEGVYRLIKFLMNEDECPEPDILRALGNNSLINNLTSLGVLETAL